MTRPFVAHFDEPETVVADAARQAGVEIPYVRSVLRDLHHVIDRLVADDWSVLLGPLYLTMRGDPVLEGILAHFTDDDWADPNGYKTAPPEALASDIGVTVEEVLRRPPAFGTKVLQRLADWRQVPLDDDAEWQRLDTVVWAWRRHLGGHGVNYRVSAAGLEKDFDIWLSNNLRALGDDYPVRVVATQHRFKNNRRLDFLCEFVRDTVVFRAGDLLVIENKANLAGMSALTQLRDYVELVESEYAGPNQTVAGLLICDGTTVELSCGLHAAGFGYLTLSALGYRDHLYRRAGLARAVVPGQRDISGSVVTLAGPGV